MNAGYQFCGDAVLDRMLRDLMEMMDDPQGYQERLKAARDQAERKALLKAIRAIGLIDHDREITVKVGENRRISGTVESAEIAWVKHNERSVKVVFKVVLRCGTLGVRREVNIERLPTVSR